MARTVDAERNAQRQAEVIKMLDAEVPTESIASELGLSVASVKRILREAGYSLPDGRKHRAAGTGAIDSEAFVADYRKRGDEAMRVADLMQKYGIGSLSSFYAYLAALGEPPRQIRDATAANRALDEAVAMYEQGYSLWEIKEETGVAQPTLHAAIHERGIPLRNRRPKGAPKQIVDYVPAKPLPKRPKRRRDNWEAPLPPPPPTTDTPAE